MLLGFKYRRIGSFCIDMAIIKMFAQLVIQVWFGIIAYLGQGAGWSLSLNSTMTLPALLLISVMVLLLFIGTYVGYHWLCYKLLGNSLSRYFLHIKVVDNNDEPLSQSRYLKREFEKVSLCVATVGIYLFYSGAQFITFGYAPYHDRRSNTKVVDA